MYKKVQVSLADGQVTTLAISPGGAMISEDKDIEPIIVMGQLAETLGCTISWSRGHIQVEHPELGLLPVEDKEGCPQVPLRLALQLIEELELVKKGMKFHETDEFEAEVQWMHQLVNTHPVLSQLPLHVKEKLVVTPSSWSTLPANRRKRRSMRKNGFVCHLYAGESEGFTLERAWKQAGGKEAELLEVDLKRGEGHDMLKADGPYSGLVRSVLEDKLLGLVGGPNCRTRSVLRHFPLEAEGAPRPIRRWGGEENGVKDLTEDERQKIEDDDVLLWRMVFLQMLATYLRRARGIHNEVSFALEQPASPKAYMPEVVSFWGTEEWKKVKEEFGWEEVTFQQKPLGGAVCKPTTFAGNMELIPENFRMKSEGKTKVKGSWELARWAPGIMNMLAQALLKTSFNRSPQLKVLSWEESVLFGHTPARRDCRVCQENQQGSPHRRVKRPLAGVLSLDTAGPLVPAYDQGGHVARYVLVGSLTWAVPKGRTDEVQDEEILEEEMVDIEPQKEDEEKEKEGGEPVEEEPEKEDLEDEAPRGGLSEAEEAEGRDLVLGDDGNFEIRPESQEEGLEDYDIRVFRMAVPMRNKKSKEVTRTTMELVLRLCMDGYAVDRIHTDRGREFSGHFLDWTRRRGIMVTKTAGDEPQANGRAEQTVKVVKNMVRKILCQAGETAKRWPWALRHCNEVLRSHRTYQRPDFPPFMQEVLVRRRRWKRDDFSPSMEKVRYLAPSPENHGHWIWKDGESPRLTRCIVRKIDSAPEESHWVAMERELLDGLSIRRRLREKTAVKTIQGRCEDEEKKTQERKQMKKVIAGPVRTTHKWRWRHFELWNASERSLKRLMMKKKKSCKPRSCQ